MNVSLANTETTAHPTELSDVEHSTDLSNGTQQSKRTQS